MTSFMARSNFDFFWAARLARTSLAGSVGCLIRKACHLHGVDKNGGAMILNEPQWYCLKTRTRYEQIARKNLQMGEMAEVFCPLIRFERARKSGKVRVTEAMFPGYLFAKFSYPEWHRRVASANGVSHIVGFGGEPSVVPQPVICELQSIVAADEIIELPMLPTVGSEVEVLDPAFAGMRALVTRVLPAQERIVVLLEMLGMEREVEVRADRVLPIRVHPMASQ